jgi:N-acetylglucosamine malate deacetylase 2
MKRTTALLLGLFFSLSVFAQLPSGPKVLVVTSHPDDETIFPVVLYKVVHDLNGIVDHVLLTDGQGGFSNTELASQYYGINLRDSVIGRTYVPAIRKRELLNAGKIIGTRNVYFMDQLDDHYSQDPKPFIGGSRWDIPTVEKKLDAILARTAYDFIIVLLPEPEQHGHHKSSSLLALRAVQRIKGSNKPVVLGALEVMKNDIDTIKFQELAGYPESRIRSGVPPFTFDRRYRFGNFNLMSYMVVHDWVVAEYKSQGDTQNNYMNKYDLEAFWYFDLNGEAGLAKTKKFFDDLKSSGYPTK